MSSLSIMTDSFPSSAAFAGGRSGAATAPAGNALGFLVFLVVNATLFVRPAEVVPELIG
jgi:hypothetical protein